MTTVSIVTPWLNASALCQSYEKSCKGAQVVVVDNGSEWFHAEKIAQMVQRMDGVYIRHENNTGFSKANNEGLAFATGDIIVFMNNDVECQSKFLDCVRQDVRGNALYGPSLLHKHGYDYIEGWCIAGWREVWEWIGGWDEDYYTGLYWEDNDLCFRAAKKGVGLIRVSWPIYHFNNYTSSKTPGAFDHSAENEQRFLERIRGWHD